jgi:hypothetical protein
VTTKAGVAGGGWSTSAAFVDYDRDGYLDIFVTRYLKWDFSMNIWCGDGSKTMRAFCHPNVFQPVTSILYHNNHDGTFTDVSEHAGIAGHPGNGWAWLLTTTIAMDGRTLWLRTMRGRSNYFEI